MKDPLERIVGIDLGTTNSLVAMVDSGIPLVLADVEGKRLTPSVVHYPGDGAAPVVGAPARRLAALHPHSTVVSVKRFMGRRWNELSEEEKSVPFGARPDASGGICFNLGGIVVTPEQVSAEILKKLARDAGRDLGQPLRRVVITVPAYFNDAQRQATKRAGERAGLVVERIVNEPTAAALAYGLNRLKERAKIAVYDFGGGTFDLSILELSEGVFRVLATHGDTRLGGDDLDRRIAQQLAERIRRGGGPEVEADPGMWARVREAAEQAKIRLSTETEAEVVLPFLDSAHSFQTRISRAELESWTRDLVERTKACCLKSLEDAKVKPAELDQVILVGGQTRMPWMRQRVAEWFECTEFEEIRGGVRIGEAHHRASGPALNTSQNPDEAVALGASVQGEILNGGMEGMLLLDVTPLSLGIETFGGLMNVLIPRNSTIPVKAGEVFTTAVDFQKEMLIHVLQGERERAKDNWTLGRFSIEFESAPRGVPRVGVQFEIDANGILHVLTRDLKTMRQKVVEMASAVDVEDTAVQQMVEESVEHAFSDLKARRWVEARLKAMEVLEATRGAMLECGALLDEPGRERVKDAVAHVERVLAAEDPTTQCGQPDELKKVVSVLDEATRPLADLVMDQAMEALLRKRGVIG